MTPASTIIRGVIGGASILSSIVPSPAAGIIGDIVDALHGLPDLVDVLGDGDWTDEDVSALRDALLPALVAVPGVPTWHARRLAGGIAAATALIVAAARKEDPVRAARRVKERDRSVAALREALAVRAVRA